MNCGNDYISEDNHNLRVSKLKESMKDRSFTINDLNVYKAKRERSFLPILKIKQNEKLINIYDHKLEMERKRRLAIINKEIENTRTLCSKYNLALLIHAQKPFDILRNDNKSKRGNSSYIVSSKPYVYSFTDQRKLRETLSNDIQQRRNNIDLKVKQFIQKFDEESENKLKKENQCAELEKYKNISTIKSFIKQYYSTSTLFNFSVKEKWKYAIRKVLEKIYKVREIKAKSKLEKRMWKRRSTMNHEAVKVLIGMKNKTVDDEENNEKINTTKIDYTPRHLAERLEHKSHTSVFHYFTRNLSARREIFQRIKSQKIHEET